MQMQISIIKKQEIPMKPYLLDSTWRWFMRLDSSSCLSKAGKKVSTQQFCEKVLTIFD